MAKAKKEKIIEEKPSKRKSPKEISLVIVESPAKAKTINKFLGDAFEVTSSMGHIIDLPASKMGVDVESDFAPTYTVIPSRKKTLTELKNKAKDAKNIYLAADPDREGEAISWHLSNNLGKDKKYYRVLFHEITKEAITDAFKHPKEIDIDKVNAQQARRVLDRLVGYNISPILWKKVCRGLSAGRVQSVAVRLIVDREKEVKAFISQEYWEILAKLQKQNSDNVFLAKLERVDDKKPEIKNKETSEKLCADIGKQEFIVGEIKLIQRKRNPGPPFITSTLQQEAFNKLRFPAERTMRIAQQLYEGIELADGTMLGLITYMRTDSVRTAESALIHARDFIKRKFGQEHLPEKPNFYRTKSSAQAAHEAVRPTYVEKEPQMLANSLTPEQFKLYDLIWKRFVASQMKPALYEVKTININAGSFLFKSSGSTVVFKGFTEIYGDDSDKKDILPEVKTGEKLNSLGLEPSQHFTQPPPRYTDATLVKALEEMGIGRPSTYAPIIATIVMRNYVTRKGGSLMPTELGAIVTELLIIHFPKIMDVKFTAHMEEELDEIEEGKISYLETMKEFYEPFSRTLEVAKEQMKDVKKEAVKTDQICEKCGAPFLMRLGRNGYFLSCSSFPKCRNAKSLPTGHKCPEPGCGGDLVQRRSKRGQQFFGCSNYPKCTHISKKLPSKDSENPHEEKPSSTEDLVENSD